MEEIIKYSEKFNDGKATDLNNAVKNAKSVDAIKKIGDYAKGMADSISKQFSKGFDKYADPDQKSQLSNAESKLSSAVDDANTKIKNKVEFSDSDIQQLKKLANEVAEKSMSSDEVNTRSEANSEEGKRGAEKTNWSKVFKILLRLGGLFGIFFSISWFANQLTGCYKYIGDDGGTKIPKPDGLETCGCSDAPTDINTIPCLNKLCGNNGKCSNVKPPDTTDQWKDWPWCANNVSPDYPTCSSGQPGEDGVVYYAFHKYSPASIIAGLPTDLINAAKGFESLVTGLLKQIIKWVILLFIIFAVLWVGKVIYNMVMSKKNKNI